MKAFNLQNLVRKNVLEMQPYSSARDEFKDIGADMLFFDANENPFENGLNRYPDPQQRTLKESMAAIKDVRTEQLILGNGSDEILDLIIRTFCMPGMDSIIVLPPTYGMYQVLAATNDIEIKEIALTSNFQPDVDRIIECTDENTKLIFLCSPNNPTGNSFNNDLIEAILTEFHGILVIDEAYIDFSSRSSWIKRLDDYPNLIVTQTLSKAYGLAGIRLGAAYASAEIIQLLNKIKPPYNVNALTQAEALVRVLDDEMLDKEVKIIVQERKKLESELVKLKFVDHIFPSDANFVLIKVDNAAKRYDELLKNGIVVRNRSNQPLCENTLRITVGTPEENSLLIGIMKKLDK